MKGKGKGVSSSALPYKRRAPKWVTLTPSAVSEIIVKLAKKGIINIFSILLFHSYLKKGHIYNNNFMNNSFKNS